MKTLQTLLPSLLLALLLTPAVQAAKPVDETRAANPDARISIENVAGSVRVTGWDRNEVHVTGTVGDATDGLSVTGGPDHLSIEVEIPRGNHGGGDVSADLEIQVPAGCQLEVETVSASIDATELSGRAELSSVSGSITLAGRPSGAEVETVSGAIQIRGSGTPVDVESVSGSITLTGVAGQVDVSTVDGSIEVTADEIRQGDFEAVSGDIRISGALAAGAELDIEGHSSSVTLAVPSGTSARFDVTTFSGDIDNGLGPAAESAGGYAPGKTLEFTLGSGSAEVSIETFSGNVVLEGM
jgi:DUF4097 and DUF4098 domain-containing protein YvlB